ncbi:pyridoxamine 5'-phosphate oxidase family protein [Thermobifida halotolerans]|uniref:Pyridoxamine 5'-phosphate oxidase family protein n=1 Tax=Thermobifida halotolerans TaxID=483545 RepID=A0AA97M4N3_9ACTN|nr:pyridoxamine 5'-phosphate oxidase family protein [Thermobifida halotolerans]UOE20393.1 pyridoxamine 5'-phosphate oxidase family protein [Thermobifida halotolerans]
MAHRQPVGELDPRYSSGGAAPLGWERARRLLVAAEVFWLSTVRPDGRPHVAPLLAVWLDEALYFCTGPTERKAANLADSPHCVLTTGRNLLGEGLDLVVEGEAARLTDDAALRFVAASFETKYGPDWHFDVRDGCFRSGGGAAVVYRVAPSTVFGFARGSEYGQTRWRFR